MSEEQTEMDLGAVDVDAVLIGQSSVDLDAESLTDKWPKTLAEAVDVLYAENVRRGMDDSTAISEAQRAVLVLANHQGGRPIYWPRGDALRIALRDRAIYLRWNGRNKEQLAREYGLIVRTVEKIYAEQYRLGIRRRQGQLFSTAGET